MANRTCPDCRESIKSDAVVCKHCGRRFSAAEMETVQQDARFPLYLIAVVLGGLILASTLKNTPEQKAIAQDACAQAGGISKNEIVTVNQSVELRAQPSANSAKLVNEQATEIMGETHYQTVDHTTRLRETCREGNWSQVAMLEPEWLAGRAGWIPSGELRTIETDSAGKREYVEADFYWDDDTENYKQQLTAAVNRIVRENNRCETVDPGTMSRAGARGTPSDPVFFITCNSGSNVFNVWFRLNGNEA